MNDILSDCVGWSCFTTKEDCDWTSRDVTSFDVKVFVDHVQSVHLLAFVLVKTFDLDIKDRIWIDFHTLVFFQVTSQFTFVVSLDAFQFFFDSCFVFIRQQFFKLICFMVPTISKNLIQVVRQSWVSMHKPTTESDTVCFVVELFWVKVVEGFQLRIFQDFSMECCNPVNTVSVVDIHVSHVNTSALIDDLNSWIFVLCLHTTVQFFDDWYQVRNHFLQEFKRPFFKRLSKDCVVSVGSHATNN
ncbi:Uncharacterised protein [Streptococcus pneumoniae]|nr:Uncharacterised protein [Streptococcus pneumoniae]CFP97882.1 Uncharacterised protein [Streptococcus pneumoniae]CFU96437.1 Uncharacterised protein [Streptococcus pneumoniae]CIV63338.1 Uncharacterised protein [Streptococcus pneumoniae]CMU10609.1 Uncharacterised protein [Streptococcus pneumoniae]